MGKESALRYSKPLLSLTWTTACPILASPPHYQSSATRLSLIFNMPSSSHHRAPSLLLLLPGMSFPQVLHNLHNSLVSLQTSPLQRLSLTTAREAPPPPPRCQYPFIPYGFTFFMYHRTENYLKLFQCFCILFTCSGIFFLKLH